MSLQNGIGNEEIIREYTNHVIGAMIITGFEWREDNAVHVSVDGGETVFGRFPEGCDTDSGKSVFLCGHARSCKSYGAEYCLVKGVLQLFTQPAGCGDGVSVWGSAESPGMEYHY